MKKINDGNTVPNQKIIHINKLDRPATPFLLLNKGEMEYASRTLDPIGFQMYIYLCSNKNGYDLALSQVALENSMGIKKTSYYKYFNQLVDKGYLVPRNDKMSIYDFHTTPFGKGLNNAMQNDLKQSSKDEQDSSDDKLLSSQNELKSSQSNREINNIQKQNKYSESFSPTVKTFNWDFEF